MEKQELKTKWDDLARELGAQVSPETEEREQVISTTASESAPPPASQPASKPETASPPPPKRSAADWDKLAGDLGLPPIETAPLPDEVEVQVEQPVASAPEVSREPAVEQPPARPPRQRPESREKREPREKRRESHRRPRRPSREPDEPRTPPVEVPSGLEGESTPEPETPPAAPREESSQPAAVSLWHKIFGSPAEQSAKFTEPPPEADEPDDRLEARDEPQTTLSGDEIRSLSGAEITAAGFVEELDREEDSAEDSALASDETAPAERKRGRTRRRRRGGRGRKSGERQGEDRRTAPAEDESSPDDFELADDFEEVGAVETDEEAADSKSSGEKYAAKENSDGARTAAKGSGRSKAAQRTIPSWDEAIGFIVDANMQSRSQRRPPSRSPSRGNSARGRTRGRRKN
jgi:ribonuclease E